MDTFLASATAWLEQWISRWLGSGADTPVLGLLSEADLGVTGLYTALTMCACAVLALYLRRRSSVASDGASNADFHPHVIRAAGKPLYVLILIYGAYVALTPVLLRIRPEQGVNEARSVMNTLFDLGAFVALCWFLFRATYVLEMRFAK